MLLALSLRRSTSEAARTAVCGHSRGQSGVSGSFSRFRDDFSSRSTDVKKVRRVLAQSAPSNDEDRFQPRLTSMTQLLLQCKAEATNEPCGLCGQPATPAAGTQLVLAHTTAPVCQDCGRIHAPSLVALVNLADAATRIGRIGRHSVFPPLTALLDLAHAAEKFTQSSSHAAA